MKNNRKNRKRVLMYFKNINLRYNLTGNLQIEPIHIYLKKGKVLFILIGSINNPKSEIIKKASNLSMINYR